MATHCIAVAVMGFLTRHRLHRAPVEPIFYAARLIYIEPEWEVEAKLRVGPITPGASLG